MTGPDLVTAIVASALGAREEPGRPLADTIAAHLRDSEALLIVDNCEHVLDASQAVREAIGAPILGPDLARFRKTVAEVRLALGGGPFTAAEQRGRAMSQAKAVALARGDPPPPTHPVPLHSPFTHRSEYP